MLCAFDERLIALPSKPGKFILAEEIVKKNLPMIFHGQTVKNASIIRIIRSADIEEVIILYRNMKIIVK